MKSWATKDSKLVLIGGIMINLDGNGADMFLPLKLDVYHHGDGMVFDLLHQTYP